MTLFCLIVLATSALIFAACVFAPRTELSLNGNLNIYSIYWNIGVYLVQRLSAALFLLALAALAYLYYTGDFFILRIKWHP